MNAQIHMLHSVDRVPDAIATLKGSVRAQAQAVWCLNTNRLAGFEFLARARKGNGLIWAPEDFVPLAERWGYLNELTMRVVKLMHSAITQLPQDGAKPLFYTVNVSPNQLADPAFVEELAKRLARMPVTDPSQIVVEIIESPAKDHDGLQVALGVMKQHGLSIALDDFGRDSANHERLAEIPWDFVKLDRSLIGTVPHSPRASTVLKSILSMARELGAKTIAEGIENNKQRTFLARSGCNFAQGFLWSRPMNLTGLVATLARC